MSTLQKVQKELFYSDWLATLRSSSLEKITWIFSPGLVGVVGNERADILAGSAIIDNNLTLDPTTVLQAVSDHLETTRPPNSSHDPVDPQRQGDASW